MKDLKEILKQKAKNAIPIQSEESKRLALKNFKTRIQPMLEAQEDAEIKGEHKFKCPLCNYDKAVWVRAAGNNHLHVWCEGCGFRLVE